MSITLSNGHKFKFVAASGTLGFDGWGWPQEKLLLLIGLLDPALFTVVTKTVTRNPRKGRNPLQAVRFIPGGTVNALGLGNPGIDALVKKIRGTSLDLVVSIAGTKSELREMIHILNELTVIKGIEINGSCPNLDHDITDSRFIRNLIGCVKLASEISRHPLILKISPAQPYLKIANETQEEVEAFSINSTPWGVIYPNQKSLLAKFGGGGVSGKAAQPLAWEMVRRLSDYSPTPIIGSGVWGYSDIAKLLELGASAVSFGSVFLCHPWRPTLYVRRFYRKK